MMKVSGLDHDSSDHLAPLPISRKDRTNRPVTHIPTYTHTHTHISCGVVKKRGRTISLRRCLFYFKISFPFFLFFLFHSRPKVEQRAHLWRARNSFTLPPSSNSTEPKGKKRKKKNERERERETRGFCALCVSA